MRDLHEDPYVLFLRDSVSVDPKPEYSSPIHLIPLELEPEPERLTLKTKALAVLRSKSALMANLAYTVTVSLLFASFAFRRADDNTGLGAFYAFCSFVLNAPMAWFFSHLTLVAVKRLLIAIKRLNKKEAAFITCFALGFVLASGTTAAGLQVAIESASGFEFIASHSVLVAIATGISLFNTFSTRFVGSAYLLYSAWHGLKNTYRSCFTEYSAYYLLRDDIKKHGAQLVAEIEIEVEPHLTPAQQLHQYALRFYPAMQRKGLRPGSSTKDRLKTAALLAVSVAVVTILMINMMPLWIKLTVNGAEKISSAFAKSGFFVFFASLSNEFFYLNSGLKFSETVVSFSENAYQGAVRKFGDYDRRKMMTGFLLTTALFFVAWGTFSYFSGEGYGEDGLEAMKGGFGDMADTLWFSWMGWFTNAFVGGYDQVATIAAGSIVNGSAMLNFFISNVSFFKEPEPTSSKYDHHKAAKALDSMIEKAEFNALEDAEVRNVVELRRPSANPYYSLWDRCFGQKTLEERRKTSEKQRLLTSSLSV